MLMHAFIAMSASIFLLDKKNKSEKKKKLDEVTIIEIHRGNLIKSIFEFII